MEETAIEAKRSVLMEVIQAPAAKPQPRLREQLFRCEKALSRRTGDPRKRLDRRSHESTSPVAVAEAFRSWLEVFLVHLATRGQPLTVARADFIFQVLHAVPGVDPLKYFFHLLRRRDAEGMEEQRLVDGFVELIHRPGLKANPDAIGMLLSFTELTALRLLRIDESSTAAEFDAVEPILARLRAAPATAKRARYIPAPHEENSDGVLCLDEVDGLIGLANVKAEVRQLANLGRVRRLRKVAGLCIPVLSLHLVFVGNPGTGKTTVARLLRAIYRKVGLLSSGHLVEADRSTLVGRYIGETASKTMDVLKSARGGVLFIDEAYSLTTNRFASDYGHEAVETLLKFMEDHRDDLVVIAAGYEAPMEAFLNTNPGLRSRFGRIIRFPDYSAEEMEELFASMAAGAQYTLTRAAWEQLRKGLVALHASRDETFANARTVRGYFEAVVGRHADRVATIVHPTREQLATIEVQDVEFDGHQG